LVRNALIAALLFAALSPAFAQTPPATAVKPLPPVAVTQLEPRQANPELDRQRISVAFSEPTSINDILLLLVRGTRLSVVPDPALDQRFLGDLKNVTVREALSLILEPLDLDYAVRGQVIRVFRRQPETRFYDVDYVSTQRSASRSVAGTTTSANNLYVDLADGVRALLSSDGRMNLDRTASLLQVTDHPSRLAHVEQYLEAVMLRATRQVAIEAMVVEVELKDQFSTGIDWRAVRSAVTTTSGTSTQTRSADARGFTLALNDGDFSSLLAALSAQGKVNVLSRPRVMAMNNEPVVMRMGTQDIFFASTTQLDPRTGQSVQGPVAPQSVTEGFALTVTPQISSDGIVHVSLNPSVTRRTGVATSRLGEEQPIVTVREADTLVRVRQGETIVIAGLLSERASQKPSATTPQKTDLVILLTPTIVGAPQR